MNHDTDFSNTGLASAIQPRDRYAALSIPGWPADLFSCDATEAEFMTEDLMMWHDPSVVMADHQYQAIHA